MMTEMPPPLSLQRYTIRRIRLLSLAKFGFVLGAVAMILPSLLCAWGGTQLVALFRGWLDTLGPSGSKLALGPIELTGFSWLDMFGLSTVQHLLINLDDQRGPVMLLIILSSIIGGGLLIGLIVMLVGWIYNLLAAVTGGLEIELR
jgi:hypothetical protein